MTRPEDLVLEKKRYKIILADPPWQFGDKNTGGSFKSGSANKYNTLNFAGICNIVNNTKKAKDCFLFLWTPSTHLKEALELMEYSGFKFKNVAFYWRKKTRTGKLHFGMGRYTRPSMELCLLGIRGKPNVLNHGVRQEIESEVRNHSQKPDEQYDRIEKLCGKLPRIELFARYYRKGWQVWGDQAPLNFITGII